MASRWDVTRAVRASDLPAPSRLIMLVLADVADVGTAEVPERFTPSLNVLARETGLDKSTVRRHLDLLEEAQWVVRMRPTEEAARREGERTRYRLRVPRGSRVPLPVGAQNHPPRGSVPLGLGAQSPHPRGTVPLIPNSSDHSDQRPDQNPSSSVNSHRPDVEKVCAHLADRMVANGCKRPKITKGWLDAARLMIDKDHHDPGHLIAVIDWCQSDEFWRGNVLSMPKLREKYDQLRLAAQRARPARASPAGGLIERNGMLLKPETAQRLDRRAYFEKLDAARASQTQLAIEGLP